VEKSSSADQVSQLFEQHIAQLKELCNKLRCADQLHCPKQRQNQRGEPLSAYEERGNDREAIVTLTKALDATEEQEHQASTAALAQVRALEEALLDQRAENTRLLEHISSLKGEDKVVQGVSTSTINSVPWSLTVSRGPSEVKEQLAVREATEHLGVIAQSTLEKDQAYANQISAAVDDQSLQQQQMQRLKTAGGSQEEMIKVERRMQRAERRRREIEIQQRANLRASLKAFETVVATQHVGDNGKVREEQHFRKPTTNSVSVVHSHLQLLSRAPMTHAQARQVRTASYAVVNPLSMVVVTGYIYIIGFLSCGARYLLLKSSSMPVRGYPVLMPIRC